MTLTATLAAALADQAISCGALGSPLMERLFRVMSGGWQPQGKLAARLASWPVDVTSRGASVPLRLGGALHALVRAGRAPGLAAVYSRPAAVTDTDFLAVVAETFVAEEAFVLAFLDSAPQTNELRRSVAIIAVAHWLHARTGLPLVTSELGASAGLNLIWDRYALAVPGGALGPSDTIFTLSPEWRGEAPQPAPHPPVLSRAGVDLNPIDPVTGRDRLMAYLWADQPERLERTERALAVLAADPQDIARADAIDWLGQRLATPRPGAVHLVYHTVAWQYFPAEGQARGEARLKSAGRAAAADAPLARFSMEADGDGPGAAMTLDLWPGGRRLSFGRIDFHGRWIDWQPPT